MNQMENEKEVTTPRRPVAVDIFAGAGGMSLGFEQAGFAVAAAVEIDPIHGCVHKFNFPLCSVIPKSVKEVTGVEIRASAGISGKVDVVFGGAPCQGFSMIGKRALDDPRNSLVMAFVCLVSELDADYFVFENVKGLTVGQHRKFLEELIEAFEQRSYAVRLPWQVLNAASYRVPQDRKRLFLMGARKGLRLPVYPAGLTTRAGTAGMGGLIAGPTCMDALHDLPDADKFQTLLNHDEVKTESWGNPSAYAREMRCGGVVRLQRPQRNPSAYAREMRCLDPEAWHFGHPRLWNSDVLTSSARTLHSDISQLRFAETDPGAVEPISRFFKLAPGGVSNTLRAGTDAARGAFTSPRPIHYCFPRCITVREMARLHGFPDWFRFHRTKWHGARQIGNSVPPPLARAVVSSLIAAMGLTPHRPAKALSLGHPALLSMDMSRAAFHLEIDVPIQRRDRKSGARKRSQIQTEVERLSQLEMRIS